MSILFCSCSRSHRPAKSSAYSGVLSKADIQKINVECVAIGIESKYGEFDWWATNGERKKFDRPWTRFGSYAPGSKVYYFAFKASQPVKWYGLRLKPSAGTYKGGGIMFSTDHSTEGAGQYMGFSIEVPASTTKVDFGVDFGFGDWTVVEEITKPAGKPSPSPLLPGEIRDFTNKSMLGTLQDVIEARPSTFLPSVDHRFVLYDRFNREIFSGSSQNMVTGEIKFYADVSKIPRSPYKVVHSTRLSRKYTFRDLPLSPKKP